MTAPSYEHAPDAIGLRSGRFTGRETPFAVMTDREFLLKLDKVLRLPEGSLAPGQRLADLPTWDSMAAVQFIVFVDQEFERTITGRQLMECRTVDDLARLVPLQHG